MRKTSEYARKLRAKRESAKAALNIRHMLRTFSESDVNNIVLPPQMAFDFLRKGTGTLEDYRQVAMALNVAIVLCHKYEHDESIEACHTAIEAMIRTHERYLKTKRMALDGPAMQEIAIALDIFHQIVNGNNPKEIFEAIDLAQACIEQGNYYEYKEAA